MKLKGAISTILLVLMSICGLTGIILYFAKSGMIGVVSRYFVLNMHAYGGFLMIAFVAWHFFLNRKIYKAEIKSKKKDSEK